MACFLAPTVKTQEVLFCSPATLAQNKAMFCHRQFLDAFVTSCYPLKPIQSQVYCHEFQRKVAFQLFTLRIQLFQAFVE